MSAVSSTQAEGPNRERQPFFPNDKEFTTDLAGIVLRYFDAIELSKMQKVSWTWHVVIQSFFHEKILDAKLSYIYEAVQKIIQQWPIANEKINRLVATIPFEKEILSNVVFQAC